MGYKQDQEALKVQVGHHSTSTALHGQIMLILVLQVVMGQHQSCSGSSNLYPVLSLTSHIRGKEGVAKTFQRTENLGLFHPWTSLASFDRFQNPS